MRTSTWDDTQQGALEAAVWSNYHALAVRMNCYHRPNTWVTQNLSPGKGNRAFASPLPLLAVMQQENETQKPKAGVKCFKTRDGSHWRTLGGHRSRLFATKSPHCVAEVLEVCFGRFGKLTVPSQGKAQCLGTV